MITENRDDIFKNQYLELTLRSHIDLTIANLIAKIIDPDGIESTHIVTITDTTNGYVLITFAINELNKLGLWKIKLYDLTTKVPGKIFKLYINDFWER